MSKANKIKKYEMYDYTGDIIAYCKFDEVESVIKELKRENEYLKTINDGLKYQKAELISTLEFIKDFGYKNSGCGFSCATVADEALKKYSGE